MTKNKLVLKIIIGAIFLCLLVGCQTNTTKVAEPSIPMKTVSQNSEEDYVTYEFQLPEDWLYGADYGFSVIAGPPTNEPLHTDSREAMPYIVRIDNYSNNGFDMAVYKDIFAGSTDAYKKKVNKSINNLASIDTGEREFLSYLDLLTPEKQPDSDVYEYAKDFECKHYRGTYGKITTVEYTVNYNNTETRTIECYREDIPYMITGAFSNDLEVSSGDIALWAADSLKVTEHFSVIDGPLKKEN